MCHRKFPAGYQFFIILILLPWSLKAASLESSLQADGAGRLTLGILGRSREYSWAWNYRYDPKGPDFFLPGMVGPYFCSGHLGDTGLGAEVRNPEYDSLARIDERTLYRPDLRSTSFSRIGISISASGDRFGLVLERRNEMACLTLRGGLSLFDTWDLEGLCQAALSEPDQSDESWYPVDSPYPGGLLISPGIRIRHMSGRHRIGISLLGSTGIQILPGMLLALASSWSKGPWRYRWRLVSSSPDYRTADAERLEFPLGISMDLNHKPSRGMQFSFDFASGARGYPLGKEIPICTGGLLLGWKYDRWLIQVESNWRDYWVIPANTACEFSWTGARSFFSVKGSCIPDDYWRFGAEGEFSVGTGLSFRLGAGVTFSDGAWDLRGARLWHLRSKITWRGDKSRIILDYSMNDIPRDWLDGPSGAGDMDFSLRYIRFISD